MESLVLVLLYCSLCWLKYEIKKELTAAKITEFFGGSKLKTRVVTSTDGMDNFLRDVGFRGRKVRPIREWLVEVFDDIRKFYKARGFYEEDGLPLPMDRMWHLAQLKENLKRICRTDGLERIPWFDNQFEIMGDTTGYDEPDDVVDSERSKDTEESCDTSSEQVGAKRKRTGSVSEDRVTKMPKGLGAVTSFGGSEGEDSPASPSQKSR